VKAVRETPSKRRNTMRSSMMLKVPAGLIAAVLAVASLAPVAQAQSSGFAARMKVPFAFQTSSGQNFAPGVYTIRMNGPHAIVIRNSTTSGLVLAQLANDQMPASQGKAVFTHYGDQYFLSTVSVAGNTSHLICYKSKAERESQIEVGKTRTAVEVALLKAGR
jgi:hypothetical protein